MGDLGNEARRQTLMEKIHRDRVKAADAADPIEALIRLRDTKYGDYLALQDAFVRQDPGGGWAIAQSAFETEIDLWTNSDGRISGNQLRTALAKARGAA
ncbi:hypothetical protein EGJ54_21965 [Pandoraea apista]|nr:hypothetical protein EGJ54_21965 [Pandoraea apista]RRX00412.1 hypothetical protein EGJ56_19210 [Pandoraea apista]